VLAFYALQKLGAVVVMLNTSWGQEEKQYALDYADVEFLIEIDGKNTRAETQRRRDSKFSIPCGPASLREADRTAVILFTSGTTSAAKGVPLSHYQLVNNSYIHAQCVRAASDDRYCFSLPLFHCFGLSADMLAVLHSGAALVFPPDRHSADIIKTVERHHCTIFHAVPTLFAAVANNPLLKTHDTSSLRAGLLGGSPASPEQYYALKNALHMRIISSLGMTEATSGVTMADYDAEDRVQAETVGPFYPHLEWKIVPLYNDVRA
jgi:fatty-acyl-CoA synthase